MSTSPITSCAPNPGASDRQFVSHGVPSSKLDYIKRIVAEKSYAKIDGYMVDVFTASAMLGVLNGINPANQAKLLSFPIERMASISFKLLKA